MNEKIYRIRYEMLGSNGIVSITMDDTFTYHDAIAYLKENISWMKSASIIKVSETVVGLFTKKDFEGVKI